MDDALLCSPATRDCWLNNCNKCKDGKVFTVMTDMDDALHCSPSTRDCWLNNCNKCKDGKVFTAMADMDDTLLCSPATRDCWLNKCKDGKVFTAMTDMDDAADLTWYVWKNDSDGRLSKVVEEGTTADLRNYICSILPQFMEHCEQATAYKLERKAIEGSENKALLQVDFSENYTCQYQDEIQSAHWNQHQVSLFTAVLWHNGMLHSIVIACHNLVHSKDSVVAYIDMLLEIIPDSVKTVSIWSDGRSSKTVSQLLP